LFYFLSFCGQFLKGTALNPGYVGLLDYFDYLDSDVGSVLVHFDLNQGAVGRLPELEFPEEAEILLAIHQVKEIQEGKVAVSEF